MEEVSEFEVKIHDQLWSHYDFGSDVAFLTKVFREASVEKVLDAFCGTGRFTFELAKSGFQVHGMDPREKMLERAVRKAGAETVEFQVGTLEAIPGMYGEGVFDAIVALHDALGFIIADNEVRAALRGAFMGLREGGLFVFSVRNSKRTTEEILDRIWMGEHVEEDGLEILELEQYSRGTAKPDIIVRRPLWLIKQKGKVGWLVQEQRMRWFRQDEMVNLLSSSGFEILACHGDTEGKQHFLPDKHDRMTFIARRKPGLPPPPPR